MNVIICATEQEARPLISLLNACENGPGQSRMKQYEYTARDGEKGALLISGMGRKKAQAAAEYALDSLDAGVVVNAGICGSLNDEFKRRAVFSVTTVFDGDSDGPDSVIVDMSSGGGFGPARLVTVSEPVFDPERRRKLSEHGDVVDMEGYAVAEACRKRDVPCVMIKGVSDYADESGRDDIKLHIGDISGTVAEAVAALIEGEELDEVSLPQKLHRFTRLEHTVFSLPLLFAGAWMGAGYGMPDWAVIFFVFLAGVGARTLGMALNRIFDRDIDALNERTAGRELPSGGMTLLMAYLVAAAGLAVYLLACLGLGPICLYLSPVPLVPLAAYSLLKRFTSLCHFGIGVCLAFAPLGAYVAASRGIDFSHEVLLLGAFAFFWISGFDIIYALQDMESDRETGVRSIPAALGYRGASFAAAVVHMAAAGAMTALWMKSGATVGSTAALVAGIGAFVFGHLQWVPLNVRFFPTSAVAGIAGALIPVMGGH